MSAEAEPNARTIRTASTASTTPLPRSWVPYGDSPYWIGERIASGGMGTVHLGLKQGALGFRRLLAIKRLHGHLAQDPDFVARYEKLGEGFSDYHARSMKAYAARAAS